MAKLINGVLLIAMCVLIMQVFSMESDNSTDFESKEWRFLLNGIILRKCKDRLNTPSPAAPGFSVTLTKLANNRLYYFSPVAALNFASAKTFCENHGMHLVIINSEAENILVFAKVAQLGLDAAATGAWIGFRDATGANGYRWVQPNVGRTRTFFVGGVSVANECAHYATGNAPLGSWSTDACSVAHSFVCEMEPPCSLLL